MENLWFKIKSSIGSIVSYLFVKYVYRYWSKLYQFLWEREFSQYGIRIYNNLDELVQVIQTCKWVSDGWKQLGDAFSSPEKVQYIIDNYEDKSIGDCDDFACYITNAIHTAFYNKKLPFLLQNKTMVLDANILTVMWCDPTNGFGGHNVCLLNSYNKIDRRLYLSYMDYGYPRYQKESKEKIVEAVVSSYAPNAKCLGWAIHDKDLNLLEIHLGV